MCRIDRVIINRVHIGILDYKQNHGGLDLKPFHTQHTRGASIQV